MQGSAELGSLRAELRAAGVFDHHEARSWLKLGFLLGTVGVCLVVIVIYGWIAALVLVPIAAVFATAAAMVGHEGSHRSFSKSPVRNALVAYLTFPLFGGLSALYWREKHDRLHHGHPNVEGVDPDIRPFPFASTRMEHERCGPKERWFQRNFQKWAFWPMSTLMALGMRRSSLVHLYHYPKRHGRDRGWWIELACQITHYTAWLVIPSLIWGPLAAFLVYSSIWALVGVFLALVFSPAHIGLPIVTEQNNDWIHQLETTRNLQLPRLISFFFIGLDHQVEHHLFPKIPHQNLPRAAKITEAFCKRHGITYMSVPYLYALADAARFMADGWKHEASDPIEVRTGIVGRLAA
jgi:fatty acid desaturase